VACKFKGRRSEFEVVPFTESAASEQMDRIGPRVIHIFRTNMAYVNCYVSFDGYFSFYSEKRARHRTYFSIRGDRALRGSGRPEMVNDHSRGTKCEKTLEHQHGTTLHYQISAPPGHATES
jgi:hypothetical protein